MTNQTIRVGFVGAGNNTRTRHIPGFRALPGIELVAVANRTKESGERVAREFDIRRVYDDWRDLVRAPDVDAVCIGTWPYVHCAITLAALDAGKHVLCEARMAMDATVSGLNVMSMGIWYEALTRWLPPASRVMAVTKTAVPRRRDAGGAWHDVRIPDHVDIL